MELYGLVFYVEQKERLKTLYKTFKQPIILLKHFGEEAIETARHWGGKKRKYSAFSLPTRGLCLVCPQRSRPEGKLFV